MNYQPVPDPTDRSAEKRGGASPALVIGLVVLAALLIFIFQNTHEVSVNFLIFDFEAPLWLLLLAVAVLGALLDGVVARAYRKLRGKEPKKT